jgi:hypothetical protein
LIPVNLPGFSREWPEVSHDFRWNRGCAPAFTPGRGTDATEIGMGRGLLLWLIGIPLPIILVVWLLGGLN